jgi:glucokinase
MMKKYIGLDIGGTKCAAVLGTLEDEVIIEKKISFQTANKTPEEILEKFSDFISEVKSSCEISGIGIACGGPLNSKKGIIMKPPSLPLWDNIHVTEYFEKRFNIPAYLKNDADACAVAEWRYGAGKGTSSMIFLTFGTGLGAGLILDGRLYSGPSDTAGEIGHVRLTNGGPVGYNKAGSCEGYCSGGGIARLAIIELEKEIKKGRTPEFLTRVGGFDGVNAKSLAEAAKEGDAFAKKIYKKSGEAFGRTLSILIDLFNPERIVVGGVFMRSGELIMPHAEKILKREALSHSYDLCRVVSASLGERIGDASALAVAKGDL